MKPIYHISSLLAVLGILLIGLTMRDMLYRHAIVSPLLPASPNSPSPVPSPTPALLRSLWVRGSNLQSIVNSEYDKNGSITSILPYWYTLDSTGTLTATLRKENASPKEATSSAKYYIIPSITDNNDATRVHAFLASKEKQQHALQLLIQDAEVNHFAGYDVHWREIPEHDSDALLMFLRTLQRNLAATERILSVTVSAPMGDSSDWGNTIGRSWPELANNVDYIRIMTYGDRSEPDNPEPLIDLFWYQTLIRFSSEILPKNKIIIGLPIVIADWNNVTFDKKIYTDLAFLPSTSPLQWIRDVDSTEVTATYSAQGILHTLWREDTQSIETKQNIAQAHHVYQFSYWYTEGI